MASSERRLVRPRRAGRSIPHGPCTYIHAALCAAPATAATAATTPQHNTARRGTPYTAQPRPVYRVALHGAAKRVDTRTRRGHSRTTPRTRGHRVASIVSHRTAAAAAADVHTRSTALCDIILPHSRSSSTAPSSSSSGSSSSAQRHTAGAARTQSLLVASSPYHLRPPDRIPHPPPSLCAAAPAGLPLACLVRSSALVARCCPVAVALTRVAMSAKAIREFDGKSMLAKWLKEHTHDGQQQQPHCAH